jgi:hypothetical protein
VTRRGRESGTGVPDTVANNSTPLQAIQSIREYCSSTGAKSDTHLFDTGKKETEVKYNREREYLSQVMIISLLICLSRGPFAPDMVVSGKWKPAVIHLSDCHEHQRDWLVPTI